MADTDRSAIADCLMQACDAAAEETLPRFRQGTTIDNKLAEGFDPVTEADRAAERVIRDVIGRRFARDTIIGEEYGTSQGSSARRWIIDPIDGTRAFITGIPVWGTLIGLYEGDRPLAGAMDQPFTGERYVALPSSNGCESFSMRASSQLQRLHTRPTRKLSQATMMTTSPHLLRNEQDERYFALEERVKMFRYGCDCYAYAMLSAGHIDLVVESGLNIYDIAALIPIIEGAGGVITNWEGGSASEGGQVIAAANRDVHAAALELLCG
ncbi:MAG: histidinol-phosphatase [Ahrensia sp.]|nr:histidinol-phosphatase [Ahrensia sp.]